MQGDLSQMFFNILVEHNDEMVMSGEFLVNLANELADAAQQSVQADASYVDVFIHVLKCPHCGGEIHVPELRR